MSNLNVKASLLKRMFVNGAINLKNHYQEIDALNVFPVPDGDTGTNMQMTIMSGIRNINEKCKTNSISELVLLMYRGCFEGSRGNSGVILSKFFGGVSSMLKNYTNDEIDIDTLIDVLVAGYKFAYKGVINPVEGTILTVVREAAEHCVSKRGTYQTINELMHDYFEAAKKTLANTPNLLPVLKDAGVVDSGGAGFCKIIEGMVLALDGVVLEADSPLKSNEEEIKYDYLVEFALEITDEDFSSEDVKSMLSLLGETTSLEVKGKALLAKVLTNNPVRVVEIAQDYGNFISVSANNLKANLEELTKAVETAPTKVSTERKKFAIISVCAGEGLAKIFKELGVTYIISGGQTMNPSTKDFLKAIEEVNADNIIIIPNNSNIIMAAEQAVSQCTDSKVGVLKAKTIAQGYASLMVVDQNASVEDNLAEMTEAVKRTNTGELTTASRDTEMNGIKITKGDYIGLANDKIVISTPDRLAACKELLNNIVNEDSEIVTIFYGEDATLDEAKELENICSELYPDVDIELVEGKQPLYPYIIAVE